MPELIESCPKCGRPLTAVCKVIVEYDVSNDGEGGQDWEKDEIFEDSSETLYFRCKGCMIEFREFELNGEGFPIRVGPSKG